MTFCASMVPANERELGERLMALSDKYEVLAASHRRLVEAVNAYCVVPAGEITSMKLVRKEFQTALAEAEELIKKEE